MIQYFEYPDKSEWKSILERPLMDFSSLEQSVKDIMENVKNRGDEALLEYAEKFDKVKLESPAVSEEEFEKAESLVDEELKRAIDLAYDNIYKFHNSQKREAQVVTTTDGVECYQRDAAIEKAGLYIPGGTAPLFSTVLMLAVPAVIAGCKEIVLATPPAKDGSINPVILYTARKTGVTKMFKMGGAQAVAAMSYGTESVPSVYKIFGPGNQWVTMAKMLSSREGIAIDMPAGPSEVMVVADKTSEPSFVAADLLSQAEHGTDSQAVMITTDKNIVKPVMEEISKQLEELPRKDIATESIKNSKIIVLENEDDLISIMNEYAAEHLILSVENYEEISQKVINAGSVFLGNYTPESAGDYASGTNHTLPTNGFAKAFSGVTLQSYYKTITFQKISREGLKNIGPAIEIMAEAELLRGHRNAVTLRLNKI